MHQTESLSASWQPTLEEETSASARRSIQSSANSSGHKDDDKTAATLCLLTTIGTLLTPIYPEGLP
jgi:hypothetical protein